MKRKAVIIANSVVSQRTQTPVKASFIRHTSDEIARVLGGLPQQYAFEVEAIINKTRTAAKSKVAKVAERAASTGGLLLVYYFGHGRLEGDDVAFAHPSAHRGQSDFLPFKQLLSTIESGGVRRVLIIMDCCYAGAAKFTPALGNSGYCLMASTAAGTRAWYEEKVEVPFGTFTTFIMNGFSSPDATVSPADDSITVGSLFKYAKSATEQKTGGRQVPHIAGNLDEALTKYTDDPVIIRSVTDAPVKSGYSKLLAVLEAIGNKRIDTMNELYRAVLHRHREAFLTPYIDADGRVAQRPAQPGVLRRYVSFLRAIGALDEEVLELTVPGRKLLTDHRRNYNDRLLQLLELYLSQFGLTRDTVRAAMQNILQRRSLTTRRNVVNELARSSGHSLSQARVGMLLDLLGHIHAIGMPAHREQVYFPWTGAARG